MADLFTLYQCSKIQNNNSVPVIAGNNAPPVTAEVSVQQTTNPVVTTNVPTTEDVPVEKVENISVVTAPAHQEEIKPIETEIKQEDTLPVMAGIVTQRETITPVAPSVTTANQETITPTVTLDVEQVDDNSTCSDNTDNISNYSNAPTGVVDAISLMEMEFPSIVSIVENLLTTGVAVLASMPKLGKSWFCLLLCIAVATGKEFLGFTTNKCEVLYLSFESTMRSLQNRLRILLQGEEIPRGIHFSTEVKGLDDGLLDFLQDTIDKNPKIKLIIVDTYQFIRKKKRSGSTLYEKEYGETGELKQFADKNGICLLLVHHLKNQKTDDVFQQMYGSNRY